MKKLLFLISTIVLLFTMSSCNTSDKNADIVTSCFPVYDLTKRIAGDKYSVSNLVKAGVEPHDYEPTTKDVVALNDCKLFIVNGLGLEHYTSSLTSNIKNKMFVSTTGIDVIYSNHTHEEGEESDSHDGLSADPHVWLNPINAIKMMENIKDRLSLMDSSNASYFEENYNANKVLFEELDTLYKTSLTNLSSTTLVTSHEAFGYLCNQYGLTQLAIGGLSTEDEPSAAKIASIIEEVKGLNCTTIFYEELVSDAIAKSIAKETGLKCDVLNPIEGLESNNSNDDYISLMEENLETLLKALK